MAFASTGMSADDYAIVADGTFVHFTPDGELGVYGAITRDTQHLNQWHWEFAGAELQSIQQDAHHAIGFTYAHPDYPGLSIERHVCMRWGRKLEEEILIHNASGQRFEADFLSEMGTAFNGIFEVREGGSSGPRRDVHTHSHDTQTIFTYMRGDNHEAMATTVESFTPDGGVREEGIEAGKRRYHIDVAPGRVARIRTHVEFYPGIPEADTALPTPASWRQEFGIDPAQPVTEAAAPLVQAADDLLAMMIRTKYGITLAAGLPRFMNQFGRDQLLTALKIMPSDPAQHYWRGEVVKGVLRYLAAYQGDEVRMYRPHNGEDPFVIETPGEIPHEVRYDELSGLGLIDVTSPLGKRPFGHYYGTSDTTPLYVAVAGEYLAATGDVDFIREIEETLHKALEWMESRYANLDANGFIRYMARPEYIPGGPLANQVWKDSVGAMVHADGRSVTESPSGEAVEAWVATIEVQAYAYRAYQAAAEIYAALGKEEHADYYAAKAQSLQEKVQEQFLTTDREGTPIYAMALVSQSKEGEAGPLNVHNSNAAHAMWTGVFGDSPEAVQPIVDSLFAPEHLWSGWGFRSLGASELAYDGHSDKAYHKGPVWPHEPIAEGLARYGLVDAVAQSTEATYALASAMPGHSLPELVAGTPREMDGREAGAHCEAEPPAALGTASRIQSWAAAAVLKAVELRRELGLPDIAEQPDLLLDSTCLEAAGQARQTDDVRMAA